MADESTERITILLRAKDADMARVLDRNNKLISQFEREATRATTTAARNIDRNMSRMGASFSSSRGQIQNVAFQLGDFATQVGSGTSATIALGQQLPQLLGGFGALGAVIGALVAVGVPLASAFLKSGEAAASASDSVDELESALKRLQAANEVYSTDGLQAVIDKYGELNAEILLLIERQRQFALESTMVAAKDAAASLRGEISAVSAALEVYNAYASSSDPGNLAEAQLIAEQIQEEFGLTILQAEALELAISAAMRTDDVEVMASAVASISTVLEDSTFRGSEFAGTLLDAESALRAVNAEAGGIGGWLGAAISGTSTWAAALWDAANAARAAALASGPVAPAVTPGTGGPGTFPASGMPAPEFNGPRPPARPAEIDFGYSPPATTGGGRSGGGGTPSPAEPAYWDELVQSVQEAQDALEAYNETADAGADKMADLFMAIVDGSKTAKEALAELLMELARIQLQKAFLGMAGAGSPLQPVFAAIGGDFGGFRAEGGPVSAGQSYVVGEQGPELFTPGASGMITPNGATGGGGAPVMNFQVDARGAVEGTAQQIEAAFRRMGPVLVKQAVQQTGKAMSSTKAFGNR
jgi:hypothetical protein